ncbi:MAG: PD40 domain-containing protein [Planctomycetes bacterium]|nr:PD40 domain-containing protein [Planctomycetota bacterium]MBI3848066.1 PD40 domain-containing protein [Planctomycetota bacterium]
MDSRSLVAHVLLFAAVARAQPIERVSVSSNGVPASGRSLRAAISADGRFVAFASEAADLVPGDTNGTWDVFVRDRLVDVTSRVSVSSDGRQGIPAPFALPPPEPSISADGRFVAFDVAFGNLVPGDTNGSSDVFVHDRLTGETSRVSVSSSGAEAAGGSLRPSLSADGRWVAFDSSASNLVAMDRNVARDVFVHDRLTGATMRASVGPSDHEANTDSIDASISADGRFVAFTSAATNLVPDHLFSSLDVYVRDRVTHTTILVAPRSALQREESQRAAISADGRYVAFDSANDFVGPDDNRLADVFVRDLSTATTTLVSASRNGGAGDRASQYPSISADGRFVAFASLSTDLVPGEDFYHWDVFVSDRDAATIRRLTFGPDLGPTDGSSDVPVISADGQSIAFESRAEDLVGGDTNGASDVFVVDRLGGRVALLGPRDGSELGGDLVRIDGFGFGPGGGAVTSVSFGGVPARIVDASPHRVFVRTPAGAGIVDVAVTGALGAQTLPAAFTYVDPALAARAGNVGAANGAREDVLLVNAVAGDPVTREITLRFRDAVRVVMNAPSSRSRARFVLYAWPGAPSGSTLTPLPTRLGRLVFAPPFVVGGPAPLAIWNNLGRPGVLGRASAPSSPAPSLVFDRPSGVPRAGRITFQGIIADDASAIPDRVSLTNAVIVREVP